MRNLIEVRKFSIIASHFLQSKYVKEITYRALIDSMLLRTLAIQIDTMYERIIDIDERIERRSALNTDSCRANNLELKLVDMIKRFVDTVNYYVRDGSFIKINENMNIYEIYNSFSI